MRFFARSHAKASATVRDACHEAVNDLRRLKGGYLGPVVIHAIDCQGEPYVVATTTNEIQYWMWDTKTENIQALTATVDEIRI